MPILRALADNTNPRSLASWARRRRFAFFEMLLRGVARPIRLLDVGGTQSFWEAVAPEAIRGGEFRVVLVNARPVEVTLPGLEARVGDARAMPELRDREFDVVFSNSVIEHVGGPNDQRRMADEVQRVGARYFVQTPNRGFPLEPHFLFPFFQHLPLEARALLLSKMRLGWIPRARDRAQARQVVGAIRLLCEHEFQALFPGARIYRERLLGLTKSFVAYQGF